MTLSKSENINETFSENTCSNVIRVILTKIPRNRGIQNILVFWLRVKANSRVYVLPSQTLFESQEYRKWRFRG